MYEFGRFRVDGDERILFDGKDTIPLPAKVFDTLLMLIENSGRALGKEEMLEKIWADTFVEENNVAQNISHLRKALHDGIDGARFIETVPKRGYRFVAPVRVIERESAGVAYERSFTRVGPREINEPDSSSFDAKTKSTAVDIFPEFTKPETHYVQNGDVNIAYQTIGEGELDIVFVMGWISHVEYFWEEPSFARFLNRLASFSRLILFDKRGTGLSDRVPVTELPTLEQRMEDVHAVLDAVGSRRAALIGVSEGGPMCSLFAATYPERTLALIMIGTYARRTRTDDYPWAPTAEQREKFFDLIQRDWGKPIGLEERAPTKAHDPEFRRWWATYLRMGASPSAAIALTRMNAEIDVRAVLPSVCVPTLVIHRGGDQLLKVEEGRLVAALIPGCKYVELDGVDHLPFVGNQEEILDEIEEFLTGERRATECDSVLATVMRIHIVKAHEQTAEFGQAAWHDLLERTKNYVRKELEVFKGREVSLDEDGLLATFDGPARAIRCAGAMTAAARRLQMRTRAGLHTGECDLVGEKISGIAVKLCEQIAEEASIDEVLVSHTVKDLVAGSGLKFEEYGTRSFPSLPGEWRLFVVRR